MKSDYRPTTGRWVRQMFEVDQERGDRIHPLGVRREPQRPVRCRAPPLALIALTLKRKE